MANPRKPSSKKGAILVTTSYVFDWVVIIALGIAGYIMGDHTPNKRPFYLSDPNISFPFTTKETVPTMMLVILNSSIPIGVILIVCLIFVPGSTVPKGTPKSLIWRRKLWELHVGWLGLALSVGSAWFFTNGMKNLFGKPRPDMLSRCKPDLDNIQKYIVGGGLLPGDLNALVSADICTNTDKALLDDGFRSFPSGHSSSAAAGLIYLSLFLASKFAVTLPFLPPTSSAALNESSLSAFPSRLSRQAAEITEYGALDQKDDGTYSIRDGTVQTTVMAARRQAAAPPIYLLVLALLPFFASIFIASSRWFDFRHHGFDIMFGYLIGTVVSIYSFRYYHLPISSGAGWAWAPRSPDRAFWAGVGCYSYATYNNHPSPSRRPLDEEEAIEMEGTRRRRTGLSPDGQSRLGTPPDM
ncbi:PAP2-domain-containing protein [Scedosporium apiospermum]|uniref:PAP2-domain-containing protein n=1 Tax=Pseudallescheria apiosperma TaxID=563466 RepID=A0A084G3A0_PSEDA|nr:PAP2-domain-containing protein [Scedosporium apiospermum]KEZ41812.1 PAP2-domain-containing protein [Scedosporium apiospermum]